MPAGRKSLAAEWLTEDGLILLEGWAREGLKDDDIANKIGISKSTFYEWKKKYQDFSDALKKGKAPVDFKVENQLLQSALGHFVTVKEPMKLKTVKRIDGKMIEEERVEYVDKQIYIAPVPICQFFWLKNRKPDKWRDKQEAQVSLSTGQLADLIDGLKEPVDNDLYAEAAGVDGAVAQEQAETD